MAEVLERAGCEVEFREAQTCCGQPAFNSGFDNEARAGRNSIFKSVRTPSTSWFRPVPAASMISHHYSELFPSRSRIRVWEFSQFLREVLKIEDFGAKLDGVVTYHDSCHALRELKSRTRRGSLLTNVRGLNWWRWTRPRNAAASAGHFR